MKASKQKQKQKKKKNKGKSKGVKHFGAKTYIDKSGKKQVAF